jgi:novobiocin biosynthesis protein NovU/D-mycarose 3-C-methyltransferase
LVAFKELGVRTLGVEPARHIARLAEQRGIETEVAFFGEDVARDIARRNGRADVITAAGVFFHVDELYDFVAGVDALLAAHGVFVVQAMYLRDIVERTAFDSIYHEHLEYYLLRPLVVLFERFGMEILDVERVDIHGGSFVLEVRRSGVALPSSTVAELLAAEEAAGLYDIEAYRDFARRVEAIRDELVALMRALKDQGSSLAAYGAPARGNTLLNFCGIGPDLLDYAAEKNALKFGLYTPGTHIPVVPEHSLAPPDYFLLLAWNFANELLAKESAYRAGGGKFVIPLPEPAVT